MGKIIVYEDKNFNGKHLELVDGKYTKGFFQNYPDLGNTNNEHPAGIYSMVIEPYTVVNIYPFSGYGDSIVLFGAQRIADVTTLAVKIAAIDVFTYSPSVIGALDTDPNIINGFAEAYGDVQFNKGSYQLNYGDYSSAELNTRENNLHGVIYSLNISNGILVILYSDSNGFNTPDQPTAIAIPGPASIDDVGKLGFRDGVHSISVKYTQTSFPFITNPQMNNITKQKKIIRKYYIKNIINKTNETPKLKYLFLSLLIFLFILVALIIAYLIIICRKCNTNNNDKCPTICKKILNI